MGPVNCVPVVSPTLSQLHILNSPAPISVSFCNAKTCAAVPFNRYASLTARGAQPAQSEWYVTPFLLYIVASSCAGTTRTMQQKGWGWS